MTSHHYPLVHVWFGDPSERELQPHDMYLAVYAAGGGKRNMANFVRQPTIPGSDASTTRFRTSDVHVYLSGFLQEVNRNNSQLFICRWASGRGEWVPKRIKAWSGANQLKLIPEWFKARFWDNKQEKKHPWFMFALLHEHQGQTMLFTSDSFPVHQYYPTGPKKTDPNDTACRVAFHKVLKQAPPTSLRPENLLRNNAPSTPTSIPNTSTTVAESSGSSTPLAGTQKVKQENGVHRTLPPAFPGVMLNACTGGAGDTDPASPLARTASGAVSSATVMSPNTAAIASMSGLMGMMAMNGSTRSPSPGSSSAASSAASSPHADEHDGGGGEDTASDDDEHLRQSIGIKAPVPKRRVSAKKGTGSRRRSTGSASVPPRAGNGTGASSSGAVPVRRKSADGRRMGRPAADDASCRKSDTRVKRSKIATTSLSDPTKGTAKPAGVLDPTQIDAAQALLSLGVPMR
eukprot:m.604306 g.604306  ORF g.604306 m.604306 type:complete len:460 (-) comp22459_c0_seq4:3556-4935(-)